MGGRRRPLVLSQLDSPERNAAMTGTRQRLGSAHNLPNWIFTAHLHKDIPLPKENVNDSNKSFCACIVVSRYCWVVKVETTCQRKLCFLHSNYGLLFVYHVWARYRYRTYFRSRVNILPHIVKRFKSCCIRLILPYRAYVLLLFKANWIYW